MQELQSVCNKAPFDIVTGQGLGVSYSSLNQVGSIYHSNPAFGQANVGMFVNLATGNFMVKDRPVQVQEINGLLEMGYYYNAQASSPQTAWQFSLKRLTQIPNNGTGIGILQEEDGHLTTYTLDPKQLVFNAPGLSDGTPYLTYDSANSRWRWYHPKTQITEYYNDQGFLIARLDAEGRATSYQYDVNNNLTQITGPSGNVYQINRVGQKVELNQIMNGEVTLLQLYTFDSLGRLTQSQVSLDGTEGNFYTTTYAYAPTGNAIQNITQNDNTKIGLTYNTNNQLTALTALPSIRYSFAYPTGSTPNQSTVRDGVSTTTTVNFDNQNRLTKLQQQTGYDRIGTEIDITQYNYNPNGQLATQINPDNQSTTFTYGAFGLLNQKNQPNGQVTQYFYVNNNTSNNPSLLNCKVQLLNNGDDTTPLKTFYVYDLNVNNTGFPFCRFEISPQGRVREYRPNSLGNIASVRDYLVNPYNTSAVPPADAIALIDMQTWVSQQNPSAVSLIEYGYNYRGQVEQKIKYTHIDDKGDGIFDESTYVENNIWDEHNDLLQKEVRQEEDLASITTQRFDGLQRRTLLVDAMLNRTTTSYTSNSGQYLIQTTLPNTTQLTQSLTTSGVAASECDIGKSNGQNQERLTTYARDLAAHPIKTTLPDGHLLYTFYDRQDRLGYQVSPLGIVTQTTYDRINCYKTTTQYANPIDPAELISPIDPSILPTASLLMGLLIPGMQDRTSYEFYDASNRKIYEVDSGQYVTQLIYDNLDRVTAKIRYATPLTIQQLQQLQQAQPLNLIPNFAVDRCTRYFYNNDNRKIAKQDGAGYVTEYVLDIAGRMSKKILYAKTSPLDLAITDFNFVRPKPTPDKDGVTYYFRDARGQILFEVDPGHYLNTYQYLPNGLPAQKTRYADQVDPLWFGNPSAPPPLPPADPLKDQNTFWEYDLLNRNVVLYKPLGKTVFNNYDVMSNVTSKQIKDLLDLQSLDPTWQHGKQSQYDGWNQTTNDANVFVNQLINEINANPDLTPEQKAQEIAAVWQNQCTRVNFDDSGLKLSSTNALGGITFFYYDADRRPIITINPVGAIIQNTLNNFDEIIGAYDFVDRIPSTQLAALRGGFITPEFQDYINSFINLGKDRLSLYQRDQRGLVTEYTDPMKNITITSYDAFKEKAVEIVPVNANQPSLIITHTYEQRGLETSVIKEADGITIQTSKEYNNIYGKCTQFTDELGTQYQTDYNPLGQTVLKRTISESDKLNIITNEITNDAFNRELTNTNALKKTTKHDYTYDAKTGKNIHKIDYPEPGVTKTIELNTFDQSVTITNSGQTQSEKYSYAAHGEIATHTDQDGNMTKNGYDILGRNDLLVNPNNVEKIMGYNLANQLTSETLDPVGLHLETVYQRDAFNQATTIFDPVGIVIVQDFDQCGRKTQTNTDPQGLNIVVQKSYNAQNTVTSKIQGDTSNFNQYEEKELVDGFNRQEGSVVDPKGLNLKNTQVLNSAGDPIASTDPNGNITRMFYDGLRRKRFVVDAKGGIYERYYNDANYLLYEKKYNTSINPNQLTNQTTLQNLLALVQPLQADTQNSLTWYYYDDNGNERFTVNSLGIVKEKRYNKVPLDVHNIEYATQIDASALNSYTTASLAALMAQEQNISPNDRHTYNVYDPAKNLCIKIDAKGYIIQRVLDNNKNIITQIRYANPVSNPEQIAQLTLAEIQKTIIPSIANPVNDRVIYKVFDSNDRPLFTVDPEGGVTGNVYDEDNNLLTETEFKNPITVPASYEALVALVKSLKPDNTIDSVTQRVWDNSNRITTLTDALGNSDKYGYDALNNTTLHQDRNQNDWAYEFDRAKRLTTETTPSVPVTTVQQVPNNKKAGPITTITGFNHNTNLFAFILAVKRAFRQNPEEFAKRSQSNINWLNNIPDHALQKASKDSKQLGNQIRAYLAAALLNDKAHEEHLFEQFAQACSHFIETQNVSKFPKEIQSLMHRHLKLLPILRRAFYELIDPMIAKELYKHSIEDRDKLLAKIRLSFIHKALSVKDKDNKSTWERIYGDYCNRMQTDSTPISNDELKVLAKACKVNLEMVNDLEKAKDTLQKGKAKQSAEGVNIFLSNPDPHRWEIFNDTENDTEGENDNLSGEPIQLVATQQTVPITKKNGYDNNGNKTQITEAFGTAQARTFNSSFDGRNKLDGTLINNVNIDDPNLPANYTSPPTQTVDLTTSVIYGAKNLKVAEQYENGQWQFYIYDSEGRQIYQVNQLGGVIQTIRNAFGEGEIIGKIKYFNLANLNLNDYTQTGIPLSVIQAAGVIVPDPVNDRVTTYTRDQRGSVILKEQGPVFYYIPNGSSDWESGVAYTQLQASYNAFKEMTYKSLLLDPAQNVWANNFTWYNRNGKVIASCNPVNAVKIYQYDYPHYDYTARQEWVNPPSQPILQTTSFAQLLTLQQPSANDRNYAMTYDLLKQKTQETQANVVAQQTNITGPGTNIPEMNNLPAQPASLSYQYSRIQKMIAKTNEAGSTEYYYQDPRGIEIARAGIPRGGLIPLTYTGNDAFGQSVLTTKFKLGTAVANTQTVPVPIALDPDDQTELKLFDVRGLASFTQNAEGFVSGHTYTQSGKTAREFYQLTNYSAVNMDEKRDNYDALDRKSYETLWRNNGLVLGTAFQYNIFNEVTGEGPGDGTWPLYRLYDTVGNIWSSNEKKGVPTITLRNSAGKITGVGQSPTQDLSQVGYAQIPNLLNLSIDDFNLNQTVRDSIGQGIVKTIPSYTTSNPSVPTNIPLNIIAGKTYPNIGQTSVTWACPQETNVIPTFTLWPLANPQQTQILPIQTQNTRRGVDVSALSTDIYGYQINYYMIDPLTQQPTTTVLYQTNGQVQFDTGNSANSQMIVTEVQNYAMLSLTGNTGNMTSVQLWQREQQIADIPVQPGTEPSQYLADLSNQISGTYTVVPIITGRDNVPQSLSFTINTNQLSPSPLSQEIDAQVNLQVLADNSQSYGQLTWTLPELYQEYPVQLSCTYTDTNNQTQTIQTTIQYENVIKELKDSQGNVLLANFMFNGTAPVKSIQQMTVSVQSSPTTLIPVANIVIPTQQTGNGQDIILNAQFAPTTTLYITPVPGYTTPPQLSFFDTSLDRLASWKLINATGVTAQGIVVDVSTMKPGNYPFKLDAISSAFTVSDGGYVYPSQTPPPTPPITLLPSWQFSFDNWKNKITEIDTVGNETNFVVDNRNYTVTKIQPSVLVVNADGSSEQAQPVTNYGRNIIGALIGWVNPNQDTYAQVVDEAAQLLIEVSPDGLRHNTQAFDGLGRITNRYDARNYGYVLLWDHRNNMTSQTLPSGRQNLFQYNEINIRAIQADPAGNTTFYDCDNKGNYSATYLPMGEALNRRFDLRTNRQTAEIDPSGSQYWNVDYFGYTTSHLDLSGANYNYQYDLKKRLLNEASSGGEHGQSLQIQTTWTSKGEQFIAYQFPVGGKNLWYTYRNDDVLLNVYDVTSNKNSTYDYDTQQRRTSVSITRGGVLIRQMQGNYDALSRINSLWGAEAALDQYYDLNSNVRRRVTRLYPPGSPPLITDEWSEYDLADRPLIYGGGLIGNSIQLVPNQGWQYAYQNGLRFQQSYQDSDGVTHVETLVNYDVDTRLVFTSNSDGYTTNRDYAWAGWPSFYEKTVGNTRQTLFNANGYLTTDVQQTDNKFASSTTYSDFILGYGLSQFQDTVLPNPNNEIQLNIYVNGFDSWLQSLLSGRIDEGKGWGSYSNSCTYTDSNGVTNGQRGVLPSSGNSTPPGQRVVFVDATYDGLPLITYTLPGVNISQSTYNVTTTQNFFDLNGGYIGAYSILQLEPPLGAVYTIPTQSYTHHQTRSYSVKPVSINGHKINASSVGSTEVVPQTRSWNHSPLSTSQEIVNTYQGTSAFAKMLGL